MNLALLDDILDWRALLRWPWQAKAALLAVCLLLVPVLTFGFWGRGLLDSIRREEGRQDQLQQQWLAQSAEVDSLVVHQARVDRLEADLSRRRRELFDDDGLASLLQGLGQLGVGLSFEQVSVLDPAPGPDHVVLPLDLRVLGEYRALKRFIAGIAGLDKLLTLHELQLTVSDSGALRLQLRLQAYRALQPETVAEQAERTLAEPRNPFEALEAWASGDAVLGLGQARMVGYLHDPGGAVALVRLGNTVHSLREGDRLANARVVAIGERHVELLGMAQGRAGIPTVLALAKE